MRKYQIVDKYSLPGSGHRYDVTESEIEQKYVADSKEEAVEKAKQLIRSDSSEFYVVEVHTKVSPEKKEFNVIIEDIN